MRTKLFLMLTTFFFITGCSQEQHDNTMISERSEVALESYDFNSDQEVTEDTVYELTGDTEENRKIIYNAFLKLEVVQYLDTMNLIEDKLSQYDGYIVSNQTSRIDEHLYDGELIVRIPEAFLYDFINTLQTEDITIHHQNIGGEDVTEAYVDLETRLTSKEKVEERLISLMEEADSTEDLLNISNELAEVQLEIEQLKGQIHYYENRAELATVHLSIFEQRTDPVHDQDLNIWERINDQWLTSYNILVVGAVNFFIFIIGNLPILLVLSVVTWFIYRYYVKNKE
ncbi:DUF4349 domain-containing protein [Amphibacillus cookii]|uniref:DUF4349 domain-containing protein n=1 Tax=Amphibacillus cookii TaxID=767787 RepID=UPI001957A7F3|nr:DUF4349 domain-containing protein [Amphibacillus cookii]MBM7542957.1 hypothetical protein [Amphibacillus cookii]